MRAVKPYYVSGYKNRVFGRFSKIINTIFSYKGNYKILPFLPVVLYVFYPLFFNVNLFRLADLDPLTLQYIIPLMPLMLITSDSLIWWIFCTMNLNIKETLEDFNPFNLIEVYKKEGLFSSILASIFMFVSGVFRVAIIPLFSFLGAGLVVVISALTMLVFKNETINFYVATLPMVLGLGYVVSRWSK